MKKVFAVIAGLMVLAVSVVSILAIWEVIVVEHIFQKSLGTFLVLFLASAILLFLFGTLYKSNDNSNFPNNI